MSLTMLKDMVWRKCGGGEKKSGENELCNLTLFLANSERRKWEKQKNSDKKSIRWKKEVLHYGRMVGGINRYDERNFDHMMSICSVSGGVKVKKRKQENKRMQLVLYCFVLFFILLEHKRNQHESLHICLFLFVPYFFFWGGMFLFSIPFYC